VAKKEFRGVSRGRQLTAAEAEKLRRLRKQAEREIPAAKSDPMRVAIAQLRAMREAQGLSLADMAERTGMTRGNIARLETQKNATLRTLERYAAGLGCVLEIGFSASNKRRKKSLASG
jgi:DNA-binding Xre family transcriptional regulator